MLAYLLLAGNAGAPVDPELVARFDQDDPLEIPFHPEERIVWRNHNGSIVFLGWQAFRELAGIGSHWTVDERGLTAFTGHCWPRMSGWSHGTGTSWAEQLRTWLGDDPDLPAARESLFGQFTILSLPAHGTGWAVPDWVNLELLFVAHTGAATAISNRSTLCALAAAPAGAKPTRSLTSAGWMVAENWLLDQETGYWDVERPKPGSAVAIRPGKGAVVIEPARSPLLPNPDEPQRSYEDILEEVELDLRATIRAVAALPIEDRMLSLSGGKDSRTLTAFVLSEGLQDRFRFATYGSPERDDAIVAKSIADRFGLDWSLADATDRSADDEIENARLHTWLMEGGTSAWGTFVRPAFSPAAVVSGVIGEMLRWGPVSLSGVGATSIDEVRARLRKSWPVDPLRALRPEVRSYYERWFDDWAPAQAATGAQLASINSLYKYHSLSHHRNGPDFTWSPRFRISPYSAPAIARANHRLPVSQRPDYRFHLDLQRSGCLELSKMPFADKPWDEASYRHLPDADEYQRIQPVKGLNADGRTWRQKRYQDYRRLIEPIVLDRGNPLHEIVDFGRLSERVSTGDVHPGRTRLIWGVLTAALWMAEQEQPIKFERSSLPLTRTGI